MNNQLPQDLKKKAEEARISLQKIKDDPQGDEERAYKSHVLDRMSDPKHWDDTTACFMLYGAHAFSKGYQAAMEKPE